MVTVDGDVLWKMIERYGDLESSVTMEEHFGYHDTEWHHKRNQLQTEIRILLNLNSVSAHP